MSVIVQRILAAVIGAAGMLVTAGYVLAIALADDRSDAAAEHGGLAGFGLFGLAIALFWGFAAVEPRTPERNSGLRMPPMWLSLMVFALLVGSGFALQMIDRADYLAPLLAVLAFVAVTAFFLRLAARWMPGHRLPRSSVVLPGLWGALITPPILLVLQGSAALVLFGAAIGGFYVNDPDFELDPNLGDRIADYVEESGSGANSTELPDIANSPTIALAITSLVAIIAPLSEELFKALGAILVLSRRAVVRRSEAFVAGVAAGLGFAIFEGIGYTLASPAAWQQVILIRAPVVVMHVAATTIVTLGWYRYRQTGRGFLPYFATGTALHAGWNAMSIGFVYTLLGFEEGSDPSASQALSMVAVLLLLGALFICACFWFVTSARRAGLSEQRHLLESHLATPAPLTQPAGSI